MIVELGHFALVLALAVATWQTVVPLYGAYRGIQGWMASGTTAALLQLALVAMAFAALLNAYLTSDFSVMNVANNHSSIDPSWLPQTPDIL